jgi:hypothetical protein
MDGSNDEDDEFNNESKSGKNRMGIDNRHFRYSFKTLAHDAKPEETNKWLKELMLIVGTQPGGAKLVTFYNFFCGIMSPSSAISTTEDDDIFAFPESRTKEGIMYPDLYPGAEKYEVSDTKSISSASSLNSGIFAQIELCKPTPKYKIPAEYRLNQWSSEAHTLDQELFTLISNHTKGKFAQIVTRSATPEPSFVKAVCHIHSDMNRSQLPATLKALTLALDLRYTGDPQKFDKLAKEMVEAVTQVKLTPELLCMVCIFNAFKNEDPAQMMIRDQIGTYIKKAEIGRETPIFDVITTTTDHLINLKAPKGATINGIESTSQGGGICMRCQRFKNKCHKQTIDGNEKCVEYRHKSGKPLSKPNGHQGFWPKPKTHDDGHQPDQEKKDDSPEEEGSESTASAAAKQAAEEGASKLKSAYKKRYNSGPGVGINAVTLDQPKNVTWSDSGVTPLSPQVKARLKNCKRIVISLCGGIEMTRRAAIEAKLEFDAWVSVEKVENIRNMALHMASSDDKPDPTYMAYDIYDITAETLKDLFTPGTVIAIIATPPCKSFSKLNSLPRRDGKPPKRLGFKSDEGKKMLQIADIIDWVKDDHDPYCITENVDFSDMTADIAIAKKRLGDFEKINSLDHGYLNRNRVYFTNFHLSSEVKSQFPSLKGDANQQLDPGRTIDLKHGHPTMTASFAYKSKSDKEKEANLTQEYEMQTSRPLLIVDALANKTETLRVTEGERLMGLKTGSTAAPDASDVDRLVALGNGVCVITFRMLITAMMEAEREKKLKQAIPYIRKLLESEATDELQRWLTDFAAGSNCKATPAKVEALTTRVLELIDTTTVNYTYKGKVIEGTAIDSGASDDVLSSVDHCNPYQTKNLSGFGEGMDRQTDGTGSKSFVCTSTKGKLVTIVTEEAHLVKALNRDLLSMGKLLRKGFSFFFGAYGKVMYMQTPDSQKVQLLLGDDNIPMLPHKVSDEVNSVSSEDHSILNVGQDADSDSVDTLRSPPCRDMSSTKEHHSSLRGVIDHDDAVKPQQHPEVRRQMATHSALCLHDIFNGCGTDKLSKTLKQTRGIAPQTLPDVKAHCTTCAKTMQVRYPDRTSKTKDVINAIMENIDDEFYANESTEDSEDGAVTEIEPAELDTDDDELPELVSNFSSDSDSDSDDDTPMPVENTASTTSLGDDAAVAVREALEKVPRFDGKACRPMERVYLDFKDCSKAGEQAGGVVGYLVLYDYGSQATQVYACQQKIEMGDGLKWFAAQFGWSKLPYATTVYSDNCGAMVHVDRMCSNVPGGGVKYQPLPPHHPNRNEAEKACNTLWAAARHHCDRSKCPTKYFRYAVEFAAYISLRMATADGRHNKTPYELLTGTVPTIDHLCRFWSKAYAKMPKPVSKRIGKQDASRSADIAYTGRFIGYHHWDTKTKTVLVGDGRLVNSIDVVINHSDYVSTGTDDDFTYAAPKTTRQADGAPLAFPSYQHGDEDGPYLEGVSQGNEGGEATDDQDELTDGQDELGKSWDSDQPYDVEKVLDTRTRTDGTREWLVKWDGYEKPTWEIDENLDGAKESIEDFINKAPDESVETSSESEEEDSLPPKFNQYYGEINSDNVVAGPRVRNHINCIQEALSDMPLGSIMTVSSEETTSSPPHPSTSKERMEFLEYIDKSWMKDINKLESKVDGFALRVSRAVDEINKKKEKAYDHQLNVLACSILGASSLNDISWKKAISDPAMKEKAIAALEKEKQSLASTILTKMSESDDDWDIALEQAVTGRYILTIKRNGVVKARGVKQGFKEDKEAADGPNFNYYSSVARLDSIRMAMFRARRGTRCIASKDVSVAFLQSFGYDGFVKYICFRDPITGQWEYFRQSGPIYGEASAPVRWEDTFGDWLVNDMKFERGDNEKSVYYLPGRDLLIITYVDDVFADGERADIEWFFSELDKRFECKEAEWLTPTNAIDHLGMEISMDQEAIYLCMNKYIIDMLHALDYTKLRASKYQTPIINAIDPNSPALSWENKAKFMKGVGMLGWLKETGRPDVSYAHSRISQHMANPNESALEALKHCCGYLKGTSHLALKSKLYEEDEVAGAWTQGDTTKWRFFSDSDFAGNAEVQNKRRSQNGEIALLNNAPVSWASKASSVGFAHESIGEAHADMSSAAAEIYAASNACCDFMHLGYVAGEMNIDFPRPFKLEVDNQAAEIFINDTAFKSKLKHIDCRQEWVKVLRDKSIMTPAHINTKDNLADLFTKILDKETFIKLRDTIMYPHPASQQKNATNDPY